MAYKKSRIGELENMMEEPGFWDNPDNSNKAMKELKKMVEDGEKTGLLCLHDPVLAMEFCDQLILMKDGVGIQVLHPHKDKIEDMEASLREIYQGVSLVEYLDKNKKRHIAMLWEETL